MAVTDRGLASVMSELEAFNIFVDRCRMDPLSDFPCHYFVTHCHADHIQGLNASWRRGTLYCTEPTRDFLMKKFGLSAGLFCVVDFHETKRIELHPCSWFEVTALDACHCLGSAMFLFEGPFGKVLHTGDFRWDRSSIFEETKAAVGDLLRDIDTIVVDNTSSTPQQTYSSRLECLELLRPVLDLYPREAVFKVGVEAVGKEELLEDIAKRLDTKVLVKPQRYRLLKAHAVAIDLSYFTTVPAEARVVAVDRREVREDTVVQWDLEGSFTVGISCSPYIQARRGQNWSSKVHKSKPHLLPFSLKSKEDIAKLRTKTKSGKWKKLLPRRLLIPYSLHSSFHETANFIKQFRPGEVQPFVYFSGSAGRSMLALNRKFCAPDLPRRRKLKEHCRLLKQGRVSTVKHRKISKHIRPKAVRVETKGDATAMKASGDFEISGYADPVPAPCDVVSEESTKQSRKRKRSSGSELSLVQMALTWLRRVDNNQIVAKIEEIFSTK